MLPEFLNNVKPGDAVKADHHNSLIKAIQRRTPTSSPSVKVVETATGFYCEAVSNGGIASNFRGLWFPSRVNDESVKIGAGSLFDGTTLHMVPETTVVVSSTALNYIYLVCALSATLVDGYVAGGIVSSTPTISASPSVLANNNTTGYIMLCTWQSGAVVDRFAYFALASELLNKRNGSVGDVTFNWWSY